MRRKDLFYYVCENNEKDYTEITNLIIEIAGFSNITEEREMFLKDFYFRLLFEIAILEKSNYTSEEIENMFNGLFDKTKINEIKSKFSIVIDMIKEKLDKVEEDIEE